MIMAVEKTRYRLNFLNIRFLQSSMTARILIVAGSDSGGGAGIQADIRTVTMLGSHAMTAITAITAQNTLGVQGVHPIPAAMVAQQMRACIDDIGVDAVKIGMIGSAATAHAIADVIETLRNVPIVFDPVMIASSGAVLADDDTTAAFGRLMQLATLVTPNCPELVALGGEQAVLATGATLLAKGGHAEGDIITDRLIGPDGVGKSSLLSLLAGTSSRCLSWTMLGNPP